MKKMLLTVIAVFAVGTAFGQVRIGNFVWARCNVGEHGKFVDNAWQSGEFYTFEEAKTACPEGWRLPAIEELDDLMRYAAYWTTVKGEDGYLFRDGKGSIFLPAAGFRREDGKMRSRGLGGYYWSSSAYGNINGYFRSFNSTYVADAKNIDPNRGFSVRCVSDR